MTQRRSATVPLSLFHAAAAAGDAQAVRLLAEAGAPPAAAEQPANPSGDDLEALGFGSLSFRWSRDASALAVAVRNGHTAVVAALLGAAEVSPHIGGQFAPLVLALGAPAAAAEPIVQLLLQAGADIKACTPRQLLVAAKASQGLARLLMGAVQQLMAAGQWRRQPVQWAGSWLGMLGVQDREEYQYSSEERHLLVAAALTDQPGPAVLEQVCNVVWEGHMSYAIAEQLLCAAAERGCLEILQLALRPVAVGSTCPVATAWLGDAVEDAADEMMQQAARADQPGAVRLLMRAGNPPSNEAIAAAVKRFSAAALGALLEDGPPDPPAVVELPLSGILLLPSSEPCRYTCPTLAVLQSRTTQEYEACEGPRAFAGLRAGSFEYFDTHPPAVHPADALLLPLLERLLAAGCRPTVYRDVPVRLEGGPLRTWKELDPLVHDSALDLEGKNRWLALALEHPQWSPQQHARFPPSFRRAVATVLLAAHRGCFSSLPRELLLHILGLAAWPLSAWAPLDVPTLPVALA